MKVLFVGLGSAGQRHLRNIVQIMGESVEIYAYRVKKSKFVLNNKLEVIDENGLEEIYNIHVVESLDDAWKLEINCVFICNPNSMHMDVLLQALDNGCNVFVEKPLSDNYENVDKAILLADKNQCVSFVGFQNRFHPCVMKAKELIMNKSVGRVLMVNAEIGEDVRTCHKYEDYRMMCSCRKDLGGGIVISQIHELDYLIYFFGVPSSVYALGGKLSDLEIDVDDVATILLKYEVEGKDIPVCIHEDFIQNPPTRKCRIVGTKGKIEFDLLTSELRVFDDSGNVLINEKYDFERNDMFMYEMQVFLDAVNGKIESNIIPLEEGAKSLKVAVAVNESLETGKIVNL